MTQEIRPEYISWTKAEYSKFDSNLNNWHALMEWLANNIKNPYFIGEDYLYFKDGKEATFYILKYKSCEVFIHSPLLTKSAKLV